FLSTCVLIFSLFCSRPRSPLFPYTTLFRSHRRFQVLFHRSGVRCRVGCRRYSTPLLFGLLRIRAEMPTCLFPVLRSCSFYRSCRSEEHTSELQSRENLVCRLLLEKKNYHYV